MDHRDFVPLDYYAANELQAMLADEDTCASFDRANLSVLVHYRSTEDKAKELILNGATSLPFAFGIYECQRYVLDDLDVNGLTKMRLRLKSFKDNNVQDIIDRHKAVTKLEVVILSKETFSAQQVNYLLKVLNEFGPRLTSFKLWIDAVCLPGTQVGSTHLEPIWTAIDKNMPKLEHLTLEIQQTVGSSPNESFTIPVSNILPRLHYFCFGSLDESCECEQDLRMFIALKEGETQDLKTRKQPKLAHIRYSPLVDANFVDSVNCDYWHSFYQLGVANINNHSEFPKFCSSFNYLQSLQIDLRKMNDSKEFEILGSIAAQLGLGHIVLRLVYRLCQEQRFFSQPVNNRKVFLNKTTTLALHIEGLDWAQLEDDHQGLQLNPLLMHFRLKALIISPLDYNCDNTCESCDDDEYEHFLKILANSVSLDFKELTFFRVELSPDKIMEYSRAQVYDAQERNSPDGVHPTNQDGYVDLFGHARDQSDHFNYRTLDDWRESMHPIALYGLHQKKSRCRVSEWDLKFYRARNKNLPCCPHPIVRSETTQKKKTFPKKSPQKAKKMRKGKNKKGKGGKKK